MLFSSLAIWNLKNIRLHNGFMEPIVSRLKFWQREVNSHSFCIFKYINYTGSCLKLSSFTFIPYLIYAMKRMTVFAVFSVAVFFQLWNLIIWTFELFQLQFQEGGGSYMTIFLKMWYQACHFIGMLCNAHPTNLFKNVGDSELCFTNW